MCNDEKNKNVKTHLKRKLYFIFVFVKMSFAKFIMHDDENEPKMAPDSNEQVTRKP